jgi:mono/diheme cytochrome c family protein
MVKKVLLLGAGALVALLLLIQLVPYGRAHDNPPVTKEAALPAAAQRVMATSCGDCHSNLTTWPGYSNVAPVSWLVQHDVDEGRDHLNFSEWDKPQPGVDKVIEKIQSGDMPPTKYTIPHPGATLNDSQKATLIAGMRQLYQTDPPPQGQRGGEGDGDSDRN